MSSSVSEKVYHAKNCLKVFLKALFILKDHRKNEYLLFVHIGIVKILKGIDTEDTLRLSSGQAEAARW